MPNNKHFVDRARIRILNVNKNIYKILILEIRDNFKNNIQASFKKLKIFYINNNSKFYNKRKNRVNFVINKKIYKYVSKI